MSVIRKTTTTESGGPDFCCSSERQDRYGDVVIASGIDLKQFSRNNVALFNHSPHAPIGVWEGMRVENNELRGRLKLAPEGTSPRIDEIRKLVEAKVLKATSIGFIPVEAEPITDAKGNRTGGMRYLKSELIEISLVATPANADAVALAKSLKISSATMKLVFKQPGELSLGERIRKARRTIRKAKLLQQKATTPAALASMARAIAIFERQERELLEELRKGPKKSAREVRTQVLAALKRIAERIAREEAASPAGQQRRQEAETIAGFSRHASKHLDPPKPAFDNTTETWRGQKIDRRTPWRGKKI